MTLGGLRYNKYLHIIKKSGIKIDVLDNDGTAVAMLMPVCDMEILNDDMIKNITCWRTRARMFFRTQFIASNQSTRNWMKSTVIPSRERVLFLICIEGRVVGHYGLCNISSESAELDNAIRGEHGGGRGLFGLVERSLINMAFNELRVEQVIAKVYSDNVPAIQLHLQQGMKEWARFPLRRITSPGFTEYVECAEKDANVARTYVLLRTGRNENRFAGLKSYKICFTNPTII